MSFGCTCRGAEEDSKVARGLRIDRPIDHPPRNISIFEKAHAIAIQARESDGLANPLREPLSANRCRTHIRQSRDLDNTRGGTTSAMPTGSMDSAVSRGDQQLDPLKGCLHVLFDEVAAPWYEISSSATKTFCDQRQIVPLVDGLIASLGLNHAFSEVFLAAEHGSRVHLVFLAIVRPIHCRGTRLMCRCRLPMDFRAHHGAVLRPHHHRKNAAHVSRSVVQSSSTNSEQIQVVSCGGVWMATRAAHRLIVVEDNKTW